MGRLGRSPGVGRVKLGRSTGLVAGGRIELPGSVVGRLPGLGRVVVGRETSGREVLGKVVGRLLPGFSPELPGRVLLGNVALGGVALGREIFGRLAPTLGLVAGRCGTDGRLATGGRFGTEGRWGMEGRAAGARP
jgi:hypothetical protein